MPSLAKAHYFEISCFVILKMPYRSQRKKRAYFRNLDKARKKECNRDYYVRNSDKLNATGRSLYEGDPSKKKAALAAMYKLQPDKKNASDKAYYHAHKEDKNASDRAYYSAHKEDKNASDRAYYSAHKEDKNASDRAYYSAHKEDRDASDRAYYSAHKEEKNAADRAYYSANREKKNAADRAAYRANLNKRKAVFKGYHATHRSARLRYFRKYHCHTKRVRVTKAKYSLAQPNQLVIEKYFRCAQANLLADVEMKTKLMKQFKSQHFGVARKLSRKDLRSTVGRLAAKRLVGRSLQLRRKYAGFLPNSTKCIKSIPLNTKDDFGMGCHTQTTEPFFYEAAYLHVRESPIPVNDDGQCVVAKEVKLEEDTVKKCAVAACAGPKQVPTGCVPHVESDKKSAECNKWECSKHCKPLNEFEVVSIVTFRAAFELSVEEVR